MKKFICLFIYSIISFTCYPQVGIHTITPAGMLEVTSGNHKKLGLVLPIVSKLEDVEHVVSGEVVKRGTTIFDEQRNTICHKTITGWSCLNGETIIDPIKPDTQIPTVYIKPSNTTDKTFFYFGHALAISSDGNSMAVGAYGEQSNATGINGDQDDISMSGAGAVYVFTRNGDTWSQQAYIKASNTSYHDCFGWSIALSFDGNTLAVGAQAETVLSTGINADQTNRAAYGAGAAYVFTRNGATWSQQAYVKASNTAASAIFGTSIVLSSDGNTMAVGARGERSSTTGINGDQTDNLFANAGAVYVFTRSGTTWSQQAYIKASNTGRDAHFGWSVALSSNGNTLAVAAYSEKSNATGINGNQTNTSLNSAGAVYVYKRSGTTWSQEAYVKASNTGQDAYFGYSVALSSNGNTLAVGSITEKSNGTGINGNQSDTSADRAGAAYVFTRSGTTWSQQAYIKASNNREGTAFGSSITLSSDGNTMAVGGRGESSNATGINGNQSDTSLRSAGAVYVFTRNGTTWEQKLYIKASNTDMSDEFGYSVGLSSDGRTLAVGAEGERSSARGINGDQSNTTLYRPGAVYVFNIK